MRAIATSSRPISCLAGGRVRVIDDLGAFDELRPQWDALAATAPFPTATHAWVASAMATLLADRQAAVAVVESRGRLVAAAPMVEADDGLELLGARELGEPADLLHETPEHLPVLARWLAGSGAPSVLRRLPTGSPTTAAMRTAARRRGILLAREVPGCPTIPLDGGWRAGEARPSSRRLSDLRRARRRSELLGEVSTDIRDPAPDEVEELLAEAVRVEAASWKGRQGTALAADPLRGPFFDELARRTAADGSLRLAFLRIDGRPVAMQIAVEHAGSYWLLKMGYDEWFARSSPGMQLMRDTILEATLRGLRSYELLGYPEPWTGIWTQESRPMTSLRLYPARAVGMARLGTDLSSQARDLLRRA